MGIEKQTSPKGFFFDKGLSPKVTMINNVTNVSPNL